MLTPTRSLVVVLVAAAALGLGGCTAGASPDPEGGDTIDSTPSSEVAASGTSPIVFAFVCRDGDTDRTETYTTYSAVWDDERTDCRAERITGTEASSQQQAALDATSGDATLEQLAVDCAVTGVAPWTGAIRSATEAHVAAGLVLYCPGHPRMDHLRNAIATYRA